jgi:cytochrome c biogenesis protein CcmG/thiol:disulfide interchange protein DsbE
MINSFIQNHWKSFSSLVLVCGLIWIVLTSMQSTGTSQGLIPAPRQGFLAPDFSLQDMAGNQVSLQALRGEVVVVNLWATWCAFCKSEMPAFQKVSETLHEANNVIILAVNSTIQDDPAKVAQFVKDYGLTYPILLDTSGRVTHAYQVRALPTTFFIDRSGIIQNVTIGGPLTEGMIRAQISALLAQVP